MEYRHSSYLWILSVLASRERELHLVKMKLLQHFGVLKRNLKPSDLDKILSDLEEPICPYCKRIFSSRGNLRRHMEIHVMSDRKRFECDICLKKYKRKDYLKEHKMTVHSPKNKWKFMRAISYEKFPSVTKTLKQEVA